jgi:hypothetical protein
MTAIRRDTRRAKSTLSIATIGPEKYDFQDLVCLRIALSLLHRDAFEMFVEPIDGEDALIKFNDVRIDLQVKGSKKQVDLDALGAWLVHFPPRQATRSLLDRLSSSADRFVLFIATGRCSDAVSPFVVDRPWTGNLEPHSRIKVKDTKALLAVIRDIELGDSELKLTRREAIRVLTLSVKPAVFAQHLSRLFIEELVTSDIVMSECRKELIERYRIPDVEVKATLAALIQSIKESKSTSAKTGELIDVVPLLRKVLEELAPDTVQPTDYVIRGDEQNWKTDLLASRVLLLSGRPRCGKSYAALAVASAMQELGFSIKQGNDVEDAQRFLLDGTAAKRIYVLDDPLGSLNAHPRATESMARLRWLIARLPPQRLLIVAQSQDQILEVTNESQLEACRIGSNGWHDLDTTDSAFLERAWRSMSDVVGFRQDVQSALAPLFTSPTVDIELGCLRHLASTADQLPSQPTTEQVVQLARQDARTLGVALANGSSAMRRLLMGLAIGTVARNPMRREELAFLMKTEVGEYPAKSDGTTFSFSADESSSYPTYNETPMIAPEVEFQLDILERRRFVLIDTTGVRFAHPYYRAAAQSILESQTSSISAITLELFRRGLFCLATNTAFATATNADWVSSSLRGHRSIQEQLYDVLVEGLDSLYPIVRDQCFDFLVKHINELPVDLRNALPRWVQSVMALTLGHVRWHEGNAWIPSFMNALDSFEHGSPMDSLDAKKIEDQLRSGHVAAINPESAAKFIQGFSYQPENLTLDLVVPLLSYDETLIRAAASRAWLSAARIDDTDIVDRIFLDAHPNVLVGAYKGVLQSWKLLPTHRQIELVERLCAAAQSPTVAVALLPGLVVFDRPERSGSAPPWDLFERIMSKVLENLPLQSHLSAARLFSVMQSAVDHCSPEGVVAICDSWWNWLEPLVDVREASDYELGVIDILIAATRHKPILRDGRIKRMISIQYTDALIHLLKDLINAWNDLTISEKSSILSLLKSDRADQRWLAAVTLTRSDVPPEVQELLLGTPEGLKAPHNELLSRMNIELLSDAVAVHCGIPGIFWDVAHSSATFKKIADLICRDPDHPAFAVAFADALRLQRDDHIAAILNDIPIHGLDAAFDLLLHQRVRTTGDYFPKTWSILFARASFPQKNRWISRLVKAAPACIDQLTDVWKWFNLDSDRHALLEKLTADVLAINYVQRLEDATAAEQPFLLQALEGVLVNDPPVLFGTYDILRDAIKRRGFPLQSLLHLIKTGRERSFCNRTAIEASYPSDYSLPSGWISRTEDK